MTAADGQLPLGPGGVRRAARSARAARGARPRAPEPPADVLPVARVALAVSLAHLDRPFDYLVARSQAESAVPGARVRARLAGQEVDGFVLDRRADSDFAGRLTRLTRVVSAEPVLAPQIARLARTVADRWAGTMADVLRLAVPPRHARVEAEPPAEPAAVPGPPPPGGWAGYPAGPGFLAALARGDRARAVWTALPGEDWPGRVATAVRAVLSAGRGALVVVPDGRDVDRVSAALDAQVGPAAHVALTADLGPAERYRRWLAVRRGVVRAVVGTRAATYAPVADLGLVAIWDDGDDVHAEPHAPYAHARDVLLLRAHEEATAALVGGFARTAEAARLVGSGWARSLAAGRAAVRRAAPRIVVAGDDVERERDPAAATARLPSLAWRAAREALRRGPVLVQVARHGYLPALACGRCRAPARCAACAGPLALPSGARAPACRWCGQSATDRSCPDCGSRGLRALAVGDARTAEELGRAFPTAPVRTSGRDGVLATVPDRPALVVATPGAEPLAAGGYAAALLLDGAAMLARPDLRAGEETLRRWLAAAALVRPAHEGGEVVVVAEAALPVVQALVRWDPAGHADRELAERRELRFPPAARVAALTGSPPAVAELVADLVAAAALPPTAQILGPVPAGEGGERALIRVPRADGAALAAALAAARAGRSARKAGEPVRVQVDPLDLG